MKEIKFRAWNKETNKMELEPSMDFYPEMGTEINSIFKNLRELVFMQYTGLKGLDKNEVCESDIVTFRCQHCITEHRVEIVWIEDAGAWGINNDGEPCTLLQPATDESGKNLGMDMITIERVLGNIYENPELLK